MTTVMQAVWNGQVIAESDDTVVVENNHYFPRTSVSEDLLSPSETTSVCPWKGTASYLSLTVAGETNRDSVFFYPEPKAEAESIRDRVAFWRGVMVQPKG